MKFDVEVNNLSLKYNDYEALKDLSFMLEGGKVYGLLGRNGAGKTSLLSLLASFRESTKGSIKITGENPFENADIMQNVHLIYEKDYKDESEKVKGMLEIIERYRPNFDAEYAQYLVKRFKLPLDKAVNKLSRGMQSALNVTMGLASRAPITIFDEAYLGMDAPTREIFYKELLADQAERPRTMILSTHLVSEMDYLFDEVIIIDKGAFVLHEEYETLISRGASITGAAEEVDDFVSGMTQLNEQQLGNTKAVMVYGYLSEKDKQEALQRGLEVGPVSLQDLFIHLTSEEV
ncbi:ABC transporter [Virgibacillus indicus]|uniref:ABC transporter n=1 Tax=Virgibacillus indicus TaxID=2024554 RepID=A0A265N7X6_9BACI|nr:ABC transporter ATP-binding protein [Virgibacillus indicus]OZU87436.1 ABC transporter [Virgibacillus indicus]